MTSPKKSTKRHKSSVNRSSGRAGKSSKQRSKSASGFKKKLLIWSLKLSVAGLMAFGLFVLIVYLGFFGRLPSMQELSQIKHHSASEVYSVDGQLMGRYFIQNRLTLDNEDISRFVTEALIATEDSRFFEHEGIDFISLGRVIVKTILLGDEAQGGGSTISQQLAKNLYPRKDRGILTLPVSKTKEIFIASRLEEIYSKEDILTLYLNTVPFGEDLYGIETAAQRFFQKKSKDLNPAESATLVGMLAANTRYNPHRNPEDALSRRNLVLERMMDAGYLNATQGKHYQESKLDVNYRRIDHNTGVAPYFRTRIKQRVEQILSEEYGEEFNLNSDGLKITTTIDARLQEYAEYAVHHQMKRLQKEFDNHWKRREPWEKSPDVYVRALCQSARYRGLKSAGLPEAGIMREMEKKRSMKVFTYDGEKQLSMSAVDSVKHYLRLLNAGFVAINPENGHVLAWVGGIDHKSFQYDHVVARRQVGSTFKPVVYTAAMMEGMEPDTYLSNERRIYKRFDDWSPGNHDGHHQGYYSLKGGLVNSVNTISADVIMQTGVNEVIDLAEDLGMTSPIPRVPSIALGTAELTLLEMVRAYTAFPNYGRPVETVELLKIEDRDGNVLWQHEAVATGIQVYDERVAHSIVDMLRGVVERGTAKSLRHTFRLSSDLGGKTGTTQDNTDGWFIGFTPGLVAGAWVGNDQPSIRFRSTALGQGGHTALPIFARFMQKVEQDTRYSVYTARSFYPLPGDLAHQLSVPDYSEEDPDRNIFDRFFDSFERPDSTRLKQMEERQQRREQRKQKDHKSILERMKELFRKN
jgi:penicillin-binding protein 1A